jgi:hypothetical protein
MDFNTFVGLLLSKTRMSQVELRSTYYGSLTRFVWGTEISLLSIALSIRRSAYCSHATALWLHGLGGNEHQIFVNAEQSEKGRGESQLNQESIHRAFRNKQRQSKLIYKIRGSEVTVLSGKNTHRLGVEVGKGPDQRDVPLTSVVRTLIDITVRPAYAGGAISVGQAFRAARGRFIATDLLTLLRELDYIYPYHQAIGFYMKCAGYPPSEQQVFAENLKFDFYLSHGLKNPSYDKEWKIFIPKELDTK